MSFLAPLYLIAGLAVGLPILFHLIRQTPKGKQVFSSVMFLSPSPPKVTKRSRVEDWLLLLLRALAICLLALAFARPFFRSAALADASADQGDRVLFLIDTSASMQRDGLWERSQKLLDEKLESIKPKDSLAVMLFDGTVRTLVSFEQSEQWEPGTRRNAIQNVIEEIELKWERTALGEAMIAAAESLNAEAELTNQVHRLIVISDLQTGSDWQPLNGYAWPENVVVEFMPVDSPSSTNASLQVVADDNLTDNILRVRVANSETAARDLFHLHWQDVFVKDNVAFNDADAVSAYVPLGQSRVLQAPEPPQDYITQRLVLTGDDEPFDNICYIARTKPWDVRIVYSGDDDATANGLSFFLKPVFPSTVSRTVTIETWNDTTAKPDGNPSLFVIGGTLTPEQLVWAREYTVTGGCTLFVARDPQQAVQVYDLIESPKVDVQEAEIDDYAMLSEVDLTYPPLQQFDDPRYADFTKLRYWKHRLIDPASLPTARIFAKHENGAPAMAEIPCGTGRVLLFSAGWNRDDSDLAVWSKFVPLMNGLLEHGADQHFERPQFTVGDEITTDQFFKNHTMVVRNPNAEIITLLNDQSYRFTMPGLFKIAMTAAELSTETATILAVNLPPEESRTAPLSLDVFKATGIKLVSPSTENTTIETALSPEQLVNQELEAKQQLWKYLLIAALAILGLETAISGLKTSRKQLLPA